MHVSVTAVGVDRPGIVAAVTDVLLGHGANIEDSRMAILGGHFAMMLIVALPAGSDPDALDAALAAPARSLDLVVAVRPVTDAAPGLAQGDAYVVTVYGADKPGIVHRVSQLLADQDVNIIDLATHVVDGDPPVYVMMLEVTVPAEGDGTRVEAALRALAEQLGVDVSMRPIEPETL